MEVVTKDIVLLLNNFGNNIFSKGTQNEKLVEIDIQIENMNNMIKRFPATAYMYIGTLENLKA